VKHLALLSGTTVYECTTAMDTELLPTPAGRIHDRCKRNGRFCYLFGPKLA
jgi:hypothetical protein